jgi:hypothetical protein
MLAFSQRLSHKAELIRSREDIRNGLDEFYEQNSDEIDGRKVNPKDLANRNDLYLAFLDSYLDSRR